MKKTLLTLALMLGAVAVMAQTNVNRATKNEMKAVSLDNAITHVQKATPAAKDLTYIWQCDFSNQSDFTFVNAAGHSIPAGRKFMYWADTTDRAGFLASLMFSDTQPYFGETFTFQRYLVENGGFQTVNNGFVGVNPITDWASIRTYVWNTTVAFTQPVVTTGVGVLDVYFSQWGRRFNYEHYYIDWSLDANFTDYDSMEFNVRGVEINSNDWIGGVKKLTLPVSDEIYRGGNLTHEGIATVGQPQLYIRFRYAAPALTSQQPHSYFWFIDDVNIADGGAGSRIDLVDREYWYGGAHHFIPQGMETDPAMYRIVVENSGAIAISNATLKTKVYAVDASDPNNYTYTYTGIINESDPATLSTARFEDTVLDNGTISEITLVRTNIIVAENAALSDGNLAAGLYAAISTFGNATDEIVLNDTTFFEVVAPVTNIFEDGVQRYDWRKAHDLIWQGQPAWVYGFITSNGVRYLSGPDGDGWDLQNYSICTRYAIGDGNNWYANGLSLVPAPDSCEAGARISVSLKYWDEDAVDNDHLITVVMNGSNPVESELYTISDSELNNGITYTSNSTQDFKTIYVPFKVSGQLTPGLDYYACYRLTNNARFAVASDNDFSNYHNFGPGGHSYNTIVTSTLASNSYAWGNFYWGSYADKLTPMIGLVVSHNSANNLSNVENIFGSMNIYPNPAQNAATLSYTLKNAGEVSIVVTDIMGREVLNLNEGKKAAGVSYEANINTASLSNGTYFYTVSVNGAKQTNKLVINK
ncbi:MAG: T9SS type A sorting domain-containing protein [Bacteroidales bacterium]|jgi:hypothetical protein|nr:T9SS type A sorting domain-containing protein [Bacteroidales bacterium]